MDVVDYPVQKFRRKDGRDGEGTVTKSEQFRKNTRDKSGER